MFVNKCFKTDLCHEIEKGTFVIKSGILIFFSDWPLKFFNFFVEELPLSSALLEIPIRAEKFSNFEGTVALTSKQLHWLTKVTT